MGDPRRSSLADEDLEASNNTAKTVSVRAIVPPDAFLKRPARPVTWKVVVQWATRPVEVNGAALDRLAERVEKDNAHIKN